MNLAAAISAQKQHEASRETLPTLSTPSGRAPRRSQRLDTSLIEEIRRCSRTGEYSQIELAAALKVSIATVKKYAAADRVWKKPTPGSRWSSQRLPDDVIRGIETDAATGLYTVAELQEKWGVSNSAIWKYAGPSRKWRKRNWISRAQAIAFLELYREGYSMSKIGQSHGFQERSVRYHIEKLMREGL
jgi:DNA-binding CsgD family transcriptional regulator